MQRLLILLTLAAPIRALRQPRASAASALQRSASAAAAPAVRAPPRTSEPAAPPTLRAPPGATLRILSESPRRGRRRPADRGRAPVVTRYERGAKFATHNDASADPERDWGDAGGQRLATVILYLNDVAAGGETSFDKLDVAVAPRRGAACVFFPADADSHRADDRTTHASLPAVDTKRICQVWRRARRVPPALGLPADAS
ncbi:procollagen-proline 4-dioxygenase [Aureococcus anophagefferens]|nr:procollagen-proline 4-dioxygenase [Aureococcus anophagefferens]